MFKLKQPIVYCDVDDTLVSWLCYPKRSMNSVELIEADGSVKYLNTIPQTIEALKLHKLRGHSIVIWSQGGEEWAHEVVKKLGLEPFVDACLPKPTWFYDDLPASAFMEEHKRKDLRNKHNGE